MYKHIKKFNKLWEGGKISTPLVILIGGYAGTGKSTLAKEISKHIYHIDTLSTGIVRSVVKGYVSKIRNPYLYVHTFNLHDLQNGAKNSNELCQCYQKQIFPVASSINKVIDFAHTEKQNWIVEGNHIFPGLVVVPEDLLIFEFYLKVSNPEIHKAMMSGPTHNRQLDAKQFDTARVLHDFGVREAKCKNKVIYEFDEATDQVLSDINFGLKKFLIKSKLLL